MSDSDESGVTYTDISSPFEELSDIESLRADDHEHFELPEMLEDPYVEVTLQAPPSLDYIPGPEEPETMTTRTLRRILLIISPMEEMTAMTRRAADQAPSAEETEPFETDESAATPPPHPAYHMIARISILDPIPMPAWSDLEIVRLLAMSSPPASPLSPWSSPPPRIPFPPLPPILSPPSPLPSASHREDRPEVTLPPQKRLEARMSRETWVRSTDASDLVHGEVMSLRTTVLGQMTEIRELHAADRRRQTVISELLRADHRRSTEITELRTSLQGHVTTLHGQVIALQA
nr:hypothetical protein [Tanacetum cinerariifolium]